MNKGDHIVPVLITPVLMILFTSCSKQAEKQIEKQEQNGDDVVLISHLRDQEVPIPVGFTPCTNEQSKHTCYKGNLSIDQSVRFYKQSMELNGWEIEDFSDTNEGLLFCNKTGKQCAISIRKSQQPTHKTDLRVAIQHVTKQSPTRDDSGDVINAKKINVF